MRSWSFAKGHGTCNDFVLLQDRHNMLDPSDDDVRFLCDRRAGVGGDGLLRAMKAEHIDSWDGDPDLWFMDYRNADGSVAELCGNGVRVFARYLAEEGLASGLTLPIATRAGLKEAILLPDQTIRVGIGTTAVGEVTPTVRLGDAVWPATRVDVGNPHAVVLLDTVAALDALDLSRSPEWEPATEFPDGVNVEFVVPVGERQLRMRVYERGSGETMSCGTGTVAAAVAASRVAGAPDGQWRVDVPGGTLLVDLVGAEGWLTGPAVVVARGEVLLPDA